MRGQNFFGRPAQLTPGTQPSLRTSSGVPIGLRVARLIHQIAAKLTAESPAGPSAVPLNFWLLLAEAIKGMWAELPRDKRLLAQDPSRTVLAVTFH